MENVEKKCFKCEKLLSISEFYKHKQMADGHLNKCKICTKSETKEREKELRKNPEWVAKERKRNREKNIRLGYSILYKPSTERRKEYDKKYNQRFPEKAMARKYTEIFLTKLPEINLHHWSYNQEDWLDIIELSIKDHYFIHRFIVYDQERMMYRTLDGMLLDTKENHVKYFEECLIKYKED